MWEEFHIVSLLYGYALGLFTFVTVYVIAELVFEAGRRKESDRGL